MLGSPAPSRSLLALAAFGLAFTLGGCVGGPAQAPVTTAGSGTGAAATTSAATVTDLPTSAPPTPSGTSAPGPSPLAPQTSTTTSPLTIFYVALNDKGQSGPMIGCGDSIVATGTPPVIYASQVEAAMSDLITDRDARHGQSGLVNTLSDAHLEFVSSSVDGDTVTVELTGDLASGGVCDDPRIVAQLTYTAMVAAGTGEAKVLINGIEVNKYLSRK